MQQRRDRLTADPRIVEVLQLPASRTGLGTWLQGLEFLLAELPPRDASTSIRKVGHCSAAAARAARLADSAAAGARSQFAVQDCKKSRCMPCSAGPLRCRLDDCTTSLHASA